jgi:hypothetical protein
MSLGSEEAAASFEAEPDAEGPNACPESISTGRIREYLFRRKAGSPASEDDLSLGEHIACCEACQETVEELNYFEDALRLHFRELAPLLKAEIHDDEEEDSSERQTLEIEDLQDQLADKLVRGIEFAMALYDLDREYEEALQSPGGLRSFQANCKAKFNRLDPDRLSALRESVIAMVGSAQRNLGTHERSSDLRKQRLCEIPIANQYPVEFLLCVSSSKSVADAKQRAWYRNPDSPNPLDIVVDMECLAQA